jgi:hypothetical protein
MSRAVQALAVTDLRQGVTPFEHQVLDAVELIRFVDRHKGQPPEPPGMSILRAIECAHRALSAGSGGPFDGQEVDLLANAAAHLIAAMHTIGGAE